MTTRSILYVDDEPEQRAFVEAVLSSAGHAVRCAAGVSEGLRIAFSEFPELVITDIMMPGESGYALCTRLKADPSTTDIPIVVLTFMEDEQAALDVGATAFLSKPIEAPQLLRTVGEILKPTHARAALDRALQRMRQRDRAGAKLQFEEVLRLDSASALARWARYYLAQLELLDGDTRTAIRLFQAILDDDTSFWRAHNRLGLIHEMEGEYPLALKHYQRSLALNTNQPPIWERLAALRR